MLPWSAVAGLLPSGTRTIGMMKHFLAVTIWGYGAAYLSGHENGESGSELGVEVRLVVLIVSPHDLSSTVAAMFALSVR